MNVYGAAVRTAQAQAYCDAIAGGTLILFAENMPATAAGADPATVVAQGTLPNPAATASAGVASRTGTWAVTGQSGAGSGTVARSFAIKNGATVVDRGSVTIAGGITAVCACTAGNTSVTAPANSIPNGANVSGTGAGIQAGTYVVSGGGTTTLVLNRAPLITNATASLTFTGDMTLDNPNIANGQAGSVSTFTKTMDGASL